jgi:sulfur carrier protein
VARLVAELQLSGQRIAVEVNEELVPRSTHTERVLEEGDRVEVVHAIGGG